MASYFDQLVADIREAAKNNKPNGDQHIPDALVPNEWREKYPGADYMVSRPLGNWFGLKKEMFPPASYWNEEQLEFMAQILTQLYLHFNFDPMLYHPYSDYHMPYDKVYDALVKGFDLLETYYHDSQQSVFFCRQEPGTCPFGRHNCYCLDTFGY